MSDLSIKDGTGSGSRAAVIDNRLAVDGVVESSFHRLSESGQGWTLTATKRTVTVTGGRVLWAASSDLPLHIFGIYVGWNGGSTNHNRMVELDVYFSDAVPTANRVALTARDTRAGETRVPEVTAWGWDGVGDGMTGGGSGVLIHSFMAGPGCTFIPIDGTLLVKTDVSIGINAKGEEVGNLVLSFCGYQEETA